MSVQLEPSVRDALEARRPVVALESAVVTHGLPRTPTALPAPPSGWSSSRPANGELAALLHRAVLQAGATPAMIAILDGALRIGLNDADITRLAEIEHPAKAAARDLAFAITRGGAAGTTVAGTLAACTLATPPLRVFATGGIGGVHRGWSTHPDISADLLELSRSPVCVVSSGAKSILDLSATLEALDSLAVPVVGFRTDWFPRFFSSGAGGLRVSARVDSARAAAELCRHHWTTLGRTSAVLLLNPVPETAALPDDEVEAHIARAVEEADRRSIRGPQLTPFLLGRLTELSGSRTLYANIALLESNASLAAEVARELSKLEA